MAGLRVLGRALSLESLFEFEFRAGHMKCTSG